MGSPKISGGMTYAEQQKLMEEEREFQATQERERRAAAEAAEARRVGREKEERAQMKLMEEQAIGESKKAEEEAMLEAEAQAEGMTNMQTANRKAVDFYSSLYSGISLQ